MAYNLKTIKKEFSQKGIFYTEKALAEYVKSFLPDNVTEVYDPTCGNGGLLSVFDDNVLKYGQEINEEQLEDAKKTLINFTGICGDTLKNPAFMDRKFKAIVANPPFGINWIYLIKMFDLKKFLYYLLKVLQILLSFFTFFIFSLMMELLLS